MYCFTAKACGRWLPLLSITLHGCTSFCHLSLHSVHCQPQPRLPMQECSHSFHSAQANPPFHSAPLWLYNPQSGTQSQNGKLHYIHPNSIHCIQSPPLLFSTQSAVCPAKYSPLNTKNPKAPPPINGAGKNKG